MAQFRFAHIGIAREGSWVTLQRDDYFPLRWAQVKDQQSDLRERMASEEMIPGGIGDAYGKWNEWEHLPEWAVEMLEREPID